jgi:hypothetical protein
MNQAITSDISGVMELVRASGLLVSLCTITVSPEVFGDSGAPDPTAEWPALAGHVDIECTAPPLLTDDKMFATERKFIPETLGYYMRHVLLGGYYPTIQSKMRANIRAARTAASTAIVFDIVNVESDSQRQMTRMALDLVLI